MPGVSLRTTFIVGFRAKRRRSSRNWWRSCAAWDLITSGVFTYSHEEGTSAHALADDVPAAVKVTRRNRLMSEQKRLVARAQKRKIGSHVQVQVEGPSPEHDLVWRGRLAGQAPDIDPMVYLTDIDPETLSPGLLLEAEIVGSREYDLLARPRAITGV